MPELALGLVLEMVLRHRRPELQQLCNLSSETLKNWDVQRLIVLEQVLRGWWDRQQDE